MRHARFGDGQSPFLSPRRVAEQLGVTLSELARLIGVARNTLTAKSGARKVDSALSHGRAHPCHGERNGRRRKPRDHLVQAPANPRLGRQDGLRSGRRRQADKVLAYLEAVRSGVYA